MKNILITGTTKGIGEALFKMLNDDFHVITINRKKTDKTENYICDLEDLSSVEILINHFIEEGFFFDTVICNAGVYLDDPRKTDLDIMSLDYRCLEKTIRINFLSNFIITKNLINEGRVRKIILISSGMGRLSEFDNLSYAYRCSKLLLNTLTISLSKVIEQNNIPISIVSVCPGWVKTDMGTMHGLIDPEEAACYIKLLIDEIDDNGAFLRYSEKLNWNSK